MKALIFYPRRPDGSAVAFCIADIDSEAAETLFVRQVFDTHDSAVTVEVFEDHTLVQRYSREDIGGRSRRSSWGADAP